jgi:redox-sensitive bicupin YhaK (pirin superfamily)
MPKGDQAGKMGGFQLWANLPASHKMMDPRYQEVKSSQIPSLALTGGVRVQVICGEVEGVRGPVQDIVIDPEYLDVSVPAGSRFVHPTKRGHTVFAYVSEGRGYFDQDRNAYAHEVVGSNYFEFKPECACGMETLVVYDDGDEVVVTATEEPVRFLLVSGRPIGEPVAWYGPIVMNTREELQVAFEEYEKGTFIKHPGA